MAQSASNFSKTASGGIGLDSGSASSAAEAVVAVLESMRRHAAPATRDDRRQFQESLAKLANTCRADLSPDSWRELCRNLDQEAARFTGTLTGYQQEIDTRTRQLLAGLCTVAEALASTQGPFEMRFRDLVRKLRNLAARNNISALSSRLEREIAILEKAASQQNPKDGSAVVTRIGRAALNLSMASGPAMPTGGGSGGERLDLTDPATGLPDRFEAMAAFERHASAGGRFSIAIALLERFAAFAERQGTSAAAQLARHFARRMFISKPATLELYAWEEGCVLVLAPGPPDLWTETCAGWEDALSGVYHLRDAGRPIQFSAQCRLWLEEARPPESIQETARRARQNKMQRLPRPSAGGGQE